jgi:cell division protein FtsN
MSSGKLRRMVVISGTLVAGTLATLYWIGVSAPPPQPTPSREASPQRGVMARPAQTSAWVETDPAAPAAAPQTVKDPPPNLSHRPTLASSLPARNAPPAVQNRRSVSAVSPPTISQPQAPAAAHSTPDHPQGQAPAPVAPKSSPDPHPTSVGKPARTPQPVPQTPMHDSPEPAATISPEERHPNQWTTPRYHVQVGIFDDRKGARALVARLEGLGFAARVVEGRPVRVWVGGFLDRRTAEDLRVHLQTAGFDAALTP